MTGGALDSNAATSEILDSTEILVEGRASWRFVGNLPYPTDGLGGVSLNNHIFMTGRENKRYHL